MDDYYEIEKEGYKNNINPFFGEFSKKFDIEPISYSNKSIEKEKFKNKIREQLKNKYVFNNEISLTITLYLDEQKRLETPIYGDLDNYAKLIIDALKGKGGLFIDDCQIQHFQISWIDSPEIYFEIEIKSLPNCFSREPLKLYEMPDKLYYPWSTDKKTDDIYKFLKLLESMIKSKIKIRHQLRLDGISSFESYQTAQMIAPILKGFHKSRIVDSGYELIDYKKWQKDSLN
jgi:Holliday junction resolvase RusA-like endonuclease